MRQTKQKGEPESQFKRLWRVATWILNHFTAGGWIAAVTLGVLFLVVATFGTVTKDDIATVGRLQSVHPTKLFYFSKPLRTETLPALFEISKTGPRALPSCEIVEQTKVVQSVSIHISNRFGKTMQGVLNTLEWAVGLFYEIKFPTTLQATVNEVLDPNFGGEQVLDLQRQTDADLIKTRHAVLDNLECEAAVVRLLKNDANALVCSAISFLRSPDSQEILGVEISAFCITLAGDRKPRTLAADYTPFLSFIKYDLGLLHTEVDRKREQ
jgi:hypothetical protein